MKLTKAEQSKRWRAANPEKNRAYQKKYRDANLEWDKARKAEWRQQNPEYHKEYREAHPELYAEIAKNFNLRHPERAAEYSKRNREANPEKVQARRALNLAVLQGRIVPQPCFVCGKKGEAHHASYASDMQLCVTWLCHRHHAQVHT